MFSDDLFANLKVFIFYCRQSVMNLNNKSYAQIL